MQALLRLDGITKAFNDIAALSDVSLELYEGEVLSLLGENGAGKTTLMNILYGALKADSGRVLVRGQEVAVSSPRVAIELGIGMVHQHFMLVPNLSVTENVLLGLRSAKEPWLDRRIAARRIESLSEDHNLGVAPDDIIENLSVGQQQKVEILKLLFRGAQVFILDEPTAVLTPDESTALFASLRSFSRDGHAVIFITHKLEEVFGHCDRIVVLRAGRVVTSAPVKEVKKSDVAKWMVGREVALHVPDRSPGKPGDVVLEVENLRVEGVRGGVAVDGVSLEIRSGEILGIAGVDGNGQTELAEVISGCLRPRSGEVRIGGSPLDPFTPKRFEELGGAFIPADRQRDGLALDLSVAENLVLRRFGREPFSRRGVLDQDSIRGHAQNLMVGFDVRARDSASPVRGLSGGNQQKVVIARELERQPSVIVASQPTRGLDIGAMEFVYEQILRLRDAGAAILLVSTELQEVLTLSDRIAVMYRGRVVGMMDASQASASTVGPLMAGVQDDEPHTITDSGFCQ